MAGQALKPPFEYYGGKAKLASQIAALLPPHERYVEPFAGGLSVLLAKKRSKAETVNDLDGDLVTFWRMVRDAPEELERVCSLTPHARQEFAEAQDRDGLSDIEVARRVFVTLTQGREHSLKAARATSWRYDTAATSRFSTGLLTKAARISALAERLMFVSIENRDAVDVIDTYGADPNACIYVDPPYLGATRGGGYRAEMKSSEEHEALASSLDNCKASVVISGYKSELYSQLFGSWHVTNLGATSNQMGNKSKHEVLWSNVPLAAQSVFDLEGL